MNTIKMRIDTLVHPERNPRKHPAKQITEMKRSVEMFGQIRPVVVDENNIILVGNGLCMAMRELGRTEVDVLRYDNLTDNQKKKLMIADNQITALGIDDYGMIEQFIRELSDDPDIPGYDEEAVKMLLAETENLTRAAMEYGKYDTEQVSQIVDTQKAREEHGVQPVAQTYAPAPQNPASEPRDVTGQGEQRQEVNKFIVCPHCGEKIYI